MTLELFESIDTKMGNIGIERYYRFNKNINVCAGFITDKNWIINNWIVPLKIFSFKVVEYPDRQVSELRVKTYHDKKVIYASYCRNSDEAIWLIKEYVKRIAEASKDKNIEIDRMFNKH